MPDNNIISLIKKRRSIRKYTNATIPETDILSILESGRWAPSGLNNQPWKFVIITNLSAKVLISDLTAYSRIIRESSSCIAVFYDQASGYDRDKDIMAIGACIQNMLLAAQSLGIGSVWLGEILNKKEKFNELVAVSREYELMAVIALGYPDEEPESTRKSLRNLIINRL